MTNLVTSATAATSFGPSSWGTIFPAGFTYVDGDKSTTVWTVQGSGSVGAVLLLKRDKWNTGQYSEINAYAVGGQAPIVQEVLIDYDGNSDNYIVELAVVSGAGAAVTIQYKA